MNLLNVIILKPVIIIMISAGDIGEAILKIKIVL